MLDDKATRQQLIQLLTEVESLITDDSADLGRNLVMLPMRHELAVSIRMVLNAEKGGHK